MLTREAPPAQPDVLTLSEAARYLRMSESALSRDAARGTIPGRLTEDGWRFLRVALVEWLQPPSGRERLLAQAGALADDPSLAELRDAVYRRRRRPETEPPPA